MSQRAQQVVRMTELLLTYLAAEPERVFTKRELLREIWGYRSERTTRTLDPHACRLRKKLGQAGAKDYVVNRGVGYRLVDRVTAIEDQSQLGTDNGNGSASLIELAGARRAAAYSSAPPEQATKRRTGALRALPFPGEEEPEPGITFGWSGIAGRRGTRGCATRPIRPRWRRSWPSCATLPMAVTASACER